MVANLVFFILGIGAGFFATLRSFNKMEKGTLKFCQTCPYVPVVEVEKES